MYGNGWVHSWRPRQDRESWPVVPVVAPVAQRAVKGPGGDLWLPVEQSVMQAALTQALLVEPAEPLVKVMVIESTFALGPTRPLPRVGDILELKKSLANDLVRRGRVDFVDENDRPESKKKRALKAARAEARLHVLASKARPEPPPSPPAPALPDEPERRVLVKTVREHVGPGAKIMKPGDEYMVSLEDAVRRCARPRPQIEWVRESE